MKARVKSTGVLVDVIPKTNTNALHSGDNIYVYAYITVLVAMDTKYLKLTMELI